MKQLYFIISIFLFLISCKKDSTGSEVNYEDIFQVNFTMDGEKYSSHLKQNELPVGTSYILSGASNISTIETKALIIDIGNGNSFRIEFGHYLRKPSDTSHNLQQVKQLLQPGDMQYSCLRFCDTPSMKGVELLFDPPGSDTINWCSTKRNFVSIEPDPVSVEQPGSSFIITEIKEATTTGVSNNAFIIKGTFSCILYETNTANMKTITDGKFTLLFAAF